MKKILTLFTVGYAVILFILYKIAISDPTSASIFGKWGITITPVYIILCAIIYIFIKRRKNEKNK